MNRKLLVLVIATITLAGCNSTKGNVAEPVLEPVLTPMPAYQPSTLNTVAKLNDADLFALTDEQQKDFLEFYYASHRSEVKKHQRVADYLQNITYGFTYRSETFTAQEALSKIEGNCLSLALLASALAQQVGIDVAYQIVNTPPVYMQNKGVNIISNHVRTFMYDPDFVKQKHYIYLSRAHAIIDYFPSSRYLNGRAVKQDEFVSMYYRNLAAQAVTMKDYDTARLYSTNALYYQAQSPENINLHAVLLNRLGHIELAQQWYEFGMQQKVKNVNLAVNYSQLLTKTKQFEKAKEVHAIIEQLDDPNPYNWVSLGDQAFREHKYHKAVKLYSKAIQQAPYVDKAYLGIAKSAYKLNDLSEARKYMRKAKEVAFLPDAKKLYEAKLATLNY